LDLDLNLPELNLEYCDPETFRPLRFASDQKPAPPLTIFFHLNIPLKIPPRSMGLKPKQVSSFERRMWEGGNVKKEPEQFNQLSSALFIFLPSLFTEFSTQLYM